MSSPRKQRNDMICDAGNAFATDETLVLDERSWEQFVLALESPAREIPQLADLFRAKAPRGLNSAGRTSPAHGARGYSTRAKV